MHSRFFICPLMVFIILSVTCPFAGWAQSAFTPGNLVVVSVNSSTAISLLEYTNSGSLVQTLALPSSGTTAITLSASASSEGALSRSENGVYLGLAGYRTGTSSSATDRVMARIDASGTYNTLSAIPSSEGFGANNIRGCVFSAAGDRYWASGTGTGGGIRTNLTGSTSGSVQVSTTIANARTVEIFNGQLYCAAASGTVQSVATVGTGLPVTTGNTISVLPGLPTSSGPSAYSFSMSTGTISNGSVLYVADDRASALGGIQKWIYTSGSWLLSYTLGTGVSNIGARGLVVDYSGFNSSTSYGAVIYATSAEASSNRVLKIVDNGAASTSTTLATAAASTLFKGINFSPVSNQPPVVNNASLTLSVGTAMSYTVTASNYPTSYTASPLPPGLFFNPATGVLYGTPTSSGNYVLTLTAANSYGVGYGTLNVKICGLSASTSTTAVSCFGGTNGSASVTVNGGTVPYTYAWAPAGGSGSVATGLTAGTYTVSVSDANTCTMSQTIMVTQPATAVTALGTFNNATCAGYCDGAMSVIVTGGTPPYTYVWSTPGYFSSIVTNLCPGSYTITATDQHNCTSSYAASVSQPNPVTIQKNQTPVLCNGGISTITLSGTGGTPPYNYSIYPAGLSPVSTYTVTAGSYSVYLSDANACFYQDTLNVNEPAALNISSSSPPILCAGSATSLLMSASGGTPPYQYKLNSGFYQISNLFNSLLAGTYTVTLKDAHACTATTLITLTEPVALSMSVSSTPVACGAVGGSISVTASGGTGLLSYALNAGSFGSNTNFPVSTAGTYTVIVKDANNCIMQSTTIVTALSTLTVNETHINPVCFGGSGQVQVNATGGTPPYTGTGSYSQVAGTQVYQVTDAVGCSASVSVTITQPTAPVVTASFQPAVACYGNAVIPSSVGLVNPVWSGGLTENNAFTAVASNTYTISGTDINGCAGSTVVSYNVNASLSQLALATPSNGSSAVVTDSASGYNFQYDGSDLVYTNNLCQLIAGMTDTAGGSVPGTSTIQLNLSATLLTYNTQPYLRRTFNVNAAVNTSATLHFYIPQGDFDEYNLNNTGFALLPQNGSNTDPYIANIRITKVSGGVLGAGNAVVLTPLVQWHAAENYWELSVAPDSVSGSYFIHGLNPLNAPLPLTLYSFDGRDTEDAQWVEWKTTRQTDPGKWVLAWAGDAVHFETLAHVATEADSYTAGDALVYRIANTHPQDGPNYYRLSFEDPEGRQTIMAPLLNIIHQHAGKSSWILYPNPASEQCTLRYDAGQHDNVHLEVYAPDGRQLKDEWHAVSPSTPLLHLSCVDWPHGIYVVRIGGIHTPSTRLLLAH